MAAIAVSVQSKEQTRGYNQEGTNPATRICSAFHLLNQQPGSLSIFITFPLKNQVLTHLLPLFPPQASRRRNMAQGLRPLLGAKGWDCCVLWRLSTDQRFLEWMGCCCGGAEETMEKVFPLGSPSTVAPPCRDMMAMHQRTWPCDALAELPSSIPLELDQPLGVHAQVLVSNQSKWMTYSEGSTTSHQRVRTRLMVPVPGGLVELFTSKQVNEDPNVAKLVLSLLNIPCELSSDKSMLYDSFLEGLAGTNNEHGPYNYSGDEQASDQVDDDDEQMVVGRPGKRHPAKNLVAERNRRKKLNDRLYQLRSLVPNISKMDKASILVDAIEYVLELQKQVKVLQDELEEVNEKNNEGERALFGGKLDVMNDNTNGASHAMEEDDSSNSSRMVEHQMEPQVEVRQLDVDEFFVKVLCEHKHGGFTMLMEAISSLHLEVTNANVTKYQTLVLNVFTVKRKDYNELFQAEETIRNSLLELTRNRNAGWPDAGDGIAGDYPRHKLQRLNCFQLHQL